jgi:predicted P-loop ATPase
MQIFYENIPAELKALPRWVCWKFEQRGGKVTKVPYTPTGRRAKSNDPATWAAFDECRAAHEGGCFDGIGFQLDGSGIVGVDIDHAKDAAGNWNTAAADITERLASYAEISPSGEGVHIFIKAVKPGNKSKNAAAGVEMYDTKRFFTVTGNLYREGLNAVQERQEALKGVYFKYLEPPQNVTATTGQEKHTAADFAPLDDAAIIELFESGKAGGQKSDRGKELQAYWKGMPGLYTDDLSAADLSLCNALAFWTQKDTAQMDRLFRQSGLYLLEGRAEKWNAKHNSAGQTYGEMTIAAAVAACNVVYSARNLTGRFNNEPVVKQNFPVCNLEGKPIKTHWENLAFLLRRWRYEVKYNEISKEVEFYRDGKKLAVKYDDFVTEMQGEANKSGLGCSRQDTRAMLNLIASKNRYNPFTDYLESCFNQWTAAGGQKVYFNRLCSALVLNTNFTAAGRSAFLYDLLRKWLLQAVKLGYNDGTMSPQNILIMQAEGGIGKTRFAHWLFKERPALVKSGEKLDPTNKDSVIKLTKYALVELGEIGQTVKAEKIDALKQFFTQNEDEYRAPFDIAVQKHPRRTSFLGTINESDFLIDRTGERRYFVLPLTAIDWQQLERLPPAMLWGEIYAAAVVDGEPWYLNYDEIKQLNQLNQVFACTTSTEEALFALLDFATPRERWKLWRVSDLSFYLFGDRKQAAKVGKVLAALAVSGRIPPPRYGHESGAGRLYLLPPEGVSALRG